ncbi:MAG: OprO/OprP family phosphate-selective porin [Alphaproteobacteria bacterium]
MKKTLLLTSAAFLLTMETPALAAETMTMEQMQKQIEMLAQKVEKLGGVVEAQGGIIEAQKAQIETQSQKIVQQEAAVSQKLANIAPAAGGTDGVKISMKPSPKIESADGKYSFQPIGRVHLDYTHFADDKRDQPNGAHFRRARIGFKGNLGEDFNYKAEMDFSGEGSNIKEMYLAYTGFDLAELWAGNFKPPVGLEQNTSSNYMSFTELSPASTAFTRDEILGAALKGGGENWSLAGGVFNEDPGNNTTDDEAVSLDARGSVDLLMNSPNVLHVGLGGSFRSPNSTTESVTLTGRPAGTGPNMITTGAITNVDRSTVWSAELAGVFGPLSFQGEYFLNNIDRANGSSPDFDGWYGQASYFLTGETRPYKGKTGNFDRVKPENPLSRSEGGWGAWEVLARYDNLDLTDRSAGIVGGEMSNVTLGVNWYMTDYIRTMLNVVDVNTNDDASVPDDDPTVATVRVQWDF